MRLSSSTMKGKKKHELSPARSPLSDAESCSKDTDRFLPIANVSRIMKRSLPANAKVSKEAKEAVQECVSEFISFITGEASDKCQREKRKTINGEDLLWSMITLGFESYVPPLKLYLNKYRETEGGENSSAAAMQGDQLPAEEAGDDQSVYPTGFSGFNGGIYTVAPAAPPPLTLGSGAYSITGGGEEDHGGAWTEPGNGSRV